jgi:hypothetical protein
LSTSAAGRGPAALFTGGGTASRTRTGHIVDWEELDRPCSTVKPSPFTVAIRILRTD